MLRFGFDLDGVLVNFVRAYQLLFVKLTGRDLFHPGDIHNAPCWNWPEWRGYTKEEVDTVWKHLRADPAFWLNLEPLPDVSTLRMLIQPLERKHEVYYITSRVGQRPKRQSELWLFEHLRYHFSVGPEVYPTVCISSEKGAMCRALKLDAYIDDNFDNANDAAATSPKTRVYLVDRNYNHLGAPGITGMQHPKVNRVRNLGHMFDDLGHVGITI